VVADWCAGLLDGGTARLGLVGRGPRRDALAVTGWMGPTNHTRTAPLAAVLHPQSAPGSAATS
jgi:hypothetical protein